MESIIQKKNFLKNDNCIFSFFKFWNMDLNFILLFFEIRILISIWIYGIWLWRQRDIVWLLDVCFVLCLILFNDFYFERWLFDKQNGLLKCFKGVNRIIGSSDRWLLPQTLWSSCWQEFFKQETNVQGSRNFHILMIYSNYGINISVSDYRLNDGCFHKNLAIHLNNSFKNYFWTACRKSWTLDVWSGRLDSGRLDAWTLGAWTLDSWALGLCTHGLCKPVHLDAWTLEDWVLGLWTLGIWTLGLRTTGRLDSGRLESGRLEVWALDAWNLDACTFGLWTTGRLYFGHLKR